MPINERVVEVRVSDHKGSRIYTFRREGNRWVSKQGSIGESGLERVLGIMADRGHSIEYLTERGKEFLDDQ